MLLFTPSFPNDRWCRVLAEVEPPEISEESHFLSKNVNRSLPAPSRLVIPVFNNKRSGVQVILRIPLYGVVLIKNVKCYKG